MDMKLLCDIAIKAAISAGNIIQKYMDSDIVTLQKKGGESLASQIVTAVDIDCEKEIRSHLMPTCNQYDIALLSEETEDDGSRFQKPFFWCIDPMDGTLAFIRKNPGFSVSIALISQDGTPHIGVVYDPSTETLYHAIKGTAAYKNNVLWDIKNMNSYLSYVTDRRLEDTPHSSQIQQMLKEYAANLGMTEVQEINGGGAVLNAIRILENGPACMLKFPKKEDGGGSIWDYAATSCIFLELGLQAGDFFEKALKLNKSEGTFMNKEGIFFSNFL